MWPFSKLRKDNHRKSVATTDICGFRAGLEMQLSMESAMKKNDGRGLERMARCFSLCRLALLMAAGLFAGTEFLSLQALAEDAATIAIAGPMVGTSFSVGVQYKVGVTAAIQTLPEGRLLGRTIVLKTYDDDCKSSIAHDVAREIVQDPPVLVIGHSCSGATMAAEPVYAEHGVLQITPASTNPGVTEMGISTIFRMIGRDDVQGRIAADRIARKYQGKRIGVVFFPSSYSEGLARTVTKTLEQYGVQPVVSICGVSASPSYAENIQALIDAGVEVLYLVGGGLDCGVFLRQTRQMDAPFEIMSSDTLVSKVFIEAAGDAGEGIPFTFPPDAAELSTSRPAVAAIRKLGQDPAGYTLLAYAAVQAWIEGVLRAKSFDAGPVAAAIRSAPVETILGPVSFDAKGDIQTAYPAFSWFVWKDGKRVPIE